MTMTQKPYRVALVGVLACLVTLATWFAGATAANAGPGDSDCAGRGIPASKIGIQLWTYFPAILSGDSIEEIAASMQEVGIRNIERFGGTFDEPTLEDYAAAYKSHQVRSVSSHGSLNLANWDQTLADAKLLNQIYIGSGGFGGPGFGSLADTLQTAANLNELGRRAHQQGLKLIVHNHDGEFTTTFPYDLDGDGDTEETSVVEIVLAETDPRWLSLELDIHWARLGLAGGRGDPDLAANLSDASNQAMLLDFIDRWNDRIVLLHVKDTAPDGDFAEIGDGTTDWAEVFRAADAVKYYFMEYDFPPDPYYTAAAGFEYLSCLNW